MIKNIFLACFFALPFLVFSQNSRWSVRADLVSPRPIVKFKLNGAENIYHNPRNYGVELGVERDWRRTERFRFYQTAMLGFSHLVYQEKVWSLESAAGWDWRIFRGLHGGFSVGGGYHRARNSDVQYKYEDGKWVTTDENKITTNRFALNLQSQIGYKITPKLDVFAGVGVVGFTPFIKLKDVAFPFFANYQPRLGVRFRL